MDNVQKVNNCIRSLYAIFLFPVRATYPALPIFLDFVPVSLRCFLICSFSMHIPICLFHHASVLLVIWAYSGQNFYSHS
jgi:hypothetical protein